MMAMRRLGAVMVAGLAAVVVLAGCGSHGGSDAAAPTTTKAVAKPAGAKENATTGCRDLYNGGPLECAANTIGPGGGLIFYDAGSVKSWGRFLEAAPWNWNPQYAPGEFSSCSKFGCGADPRSMLHPVANQTQDVARHDAYGLCGSDLIGNSFDKNQIGKTATAVGTGRSNTKALLANSQCAEIGSGSDIGVVRLVASYRGGGLDDWFIPSRDELDLLYRFGNRNGLGGFDGFDLPWYVSSSVDGGKVSRQSFGYWGKQNWEDSIENDNDGVWNHWYAVRPIRAFS